MTDKPNAILEGADHDTTCWIAYHPVELDIPKNVLLIDVGDRNIMPLYGRVDFSNLKSFQRVQRATVGKGYDLKNKRLNWVFEMQRSITTSDGRMYIHPIFFEEGWEYYAKVVPEILEDCSNFFSGREDITGLNARVRRAF